MWMKECGTSGDDQTDIQDMITDLLHLARVVGSMRLEDIMWRAQGNHDAEMAEDGGNAGSRDSLGAGKSGLTL